VRNGKRRLSSTIILLVTLFLLLAATPAFAYLYRAPVAITENTSTSYDMLPVLWDQNNTWLASNGFMNSTANDTRVQTLGGSNKPHMVADNKTLTAIPVPASSQTNLYFVTGESELSAFDIIVGYDGYFTVDDAAAIELSDNFTIEQSGWVDTDNATDKNLVYKQDAFRTYVSPTVSGNITSGIASDHIPTSTVAAGGWNNPGNTWDDNIGTQADMMKATMAPVWGAYITLGFNACNAVGVKYYCSTTGSIDQITLGIYDGAWHTVYEGAFSESAWITKTTDYPNATQVRMRFHWQDTGGGNKWAYIWELRVLEETRVTATGVTSGEHTVKTQMVDNTGAGWLAGWDKRTRFDTDHTKVDTNLTWFPTLVKLSSSSGIGSDDVTAIFDELGANYLKLAITESDGTTEMYVEVEKWDSGAEEAWLWTSSNTTTISSGTDTTFYLYYDNDHADNVAHVGVPNDAVVHNVWDGDFVLVDHMQDDPDTSHTRDSTSNDNDGTKKGANEPIEASSRIGDAQDFDTTDDYIDYGNGFTDINTFTWSCIYKPASFPDSQNPIAKRHFKHFRVNSADHTLWFSIAGTNTNQSKSTDTLTAGQWARLDATYDDAGDRKIYLYLNGEEVTYSQQIAVTGVLGTDAANNLWSGKYEDTAVSSNGIIDEVRISSSVRSAAWLKATYHTCWDNFIDFIPDADGDLDEFALDFSILIDGTEEDRTSGVAVPDNANGWTFMQNNVMPYADNIKIETDGVLQAWYEPNDIIAGTTLPDRAGGDNPGTFSWGSNPSNVGASLGSISGLPVIQARTTFSP